MDKLVILKIMRDVHLSGHKHQTTITQQPQQPQHQMLVIHVCQPGLFCSFGNFGFVQNICINPILVHHMFFS